MRRRRLAAELRRLRGDSGLSIEDVARALKWPGSKISRIETRQVGISTRDLRKLLEFYRIDDGERSRLMKRSGALSRPKRSRQMIRVR
jgi:transcriptional regulator with XRE-family HTH domain